MDVGAAVRVGFGVECGTSVGVIVTVGNTVGASCVVTVWQPTMSTHISVRFLISLIALSMPPLSNYANLPFHAIASQFRIE